MATVLARFRSFVRGVTRRDRFEHAMAEEMRFHLAQYTEDLVRSGVPPAEAARRARMEFGSVDVAKDDCRQARGLRLVDELRRDTRYAVRLLLKTPGFTMTALATVALCLGANLAIFAVVDSVLLRPLPFPDGERLVGIYNTYPRAGVMNDGISITNYFERRGHIPALASIAIYREGTSVVGERGATSREYVAVVSPEFFATLGLGPVMGRAFNEAETSYETNKVAILTDAFWRQRLNADPQVIGRTIRVDGNAMTVVGVLPASFSFLSSKARLYMPLATSPEQRTPDRRHWGSAGRMIARLAPGVTLTEAQAQIDAHNTAMERDSGGDKAKAMTDAGFRSLVVPLHADHVASIRPTVLLLQMGAGLLLLIGAVNLVNLLLIRASSQSRDIAVRQAIGASRPQIVSQVLVETTVLTVIGGLLGLSVGAAGVRLLMLLGADKLPLGTHIAFDARLALEAMIAAVAMGIAIGLPIVWYHAHAHTAQTLQGESRTSTAGRLAQRVRHVFLVAQMALAFILLAGAGLLAVSLRQAMAVAPGFQPQQVMTGQISLPYTSYPNPASGLAFTDRLMEALRQQPGVAAVGIATNVPLNGWSGKSAATIKGRVPQPGEAPRGHYSYSVGGEYFAAMGFSLKEGRFLTADDGHHAERVVVVDEDFAHYYWPNGGAIGQRLFEGSSEGKDADAFTIVGIVGAARQAGLTDEVAQGAIYYPYAQRPDSGMFVVVRGTAQAETLSRTLQQVVRQLDPDLPVNDLRSMDTRIADSLITRRSPALLAMAFAAMAVLLTAIGTYGVLSYAVAQRRREIGLRMALGAQPGQVRSQFLALALRLLAIGTGLGLFGAWLTGQAMQTLLYHVPPLHLATLAGTAAIMTIVCLIACLLPSHRAARISPMEALTDQ